MSAKSSISDKTILDLTCEGLSAQQIADMSSVKKRTIEMRIHTLKHKNHCNNLVSLCVKYSLYAHNVIKNFYL